MTTISCPTPGLEIIQHASQRSREVCKQPGINRSSGKNSYSMCLIGTEWKETRDATCQRWLLSLNNIPSHKQSTWQMHLSGEMKVDYQTSCHFWHKHAHCLKRPTSTTEPILALNILYTGLMYIIRVQPQRQFQNEEIIKAISTERK